MRLPEKLELLYLDLTDYIDKGGKNPFPIRRYLPVNVGCTFPKYYPRTVLNYGDILVEPINEEDFKPFLFYFQNGVVYFFNKGKKKISDQYTKDGHTLLTLLNTDLIELFIVKPKTKVYQKYLKQFLTKSKFRLIYLSDQKKGE